MDSAANLVTKLDAWLPQTQCTQCGYPRCRLYAEAIARGEADINQCPPGGDVTLQALADLMQTAVKPLNPSHGKYEARKLAVIDEAICIGCKKCIEVCPTDAIVGAAKLMHTVIASECTGCGLCVPPCPVDCIALPPVSKSGDVWPEYSKTEADHWRDRTQRRLTRLARQQSQRASRKQRKSIFPDSATVRADITAALERVRQKKKNDAP
jgi:Na+-translocating ferredoxin:NAD+ oxidoreductase subunit B